jgi:hypothetical protein
VVQQNVGAPWPLGPWRWRDEGGAVARLQSSSAVRGSRVSLDGDDEVVLDSFPFPLLIFSSLPSTQVAVDLGKTP